MNRILEIVNRTHVGALMPSEKELEVVTERPAGSASKRHSSLDRKQWQL